MENKPNKCEKIFNIYNLNLNGNYILFLAHFLHPVFSASMLCFELGNRNEKADLAALVRKYKHMDATLLPKHGKILKYSSSCAGQRRIFQAKRQNQEGEIFRFPLRSSQLKVNPILPRFLRFFRETFESPEIFISFYRFPLDYVKCFYSLPIFVNQNIVRNPSPSCFSLTVSKIPPPLKNGPQTLGWLLDRKSCKTYWSSIFLKSTVTFNRKQVWFNMTSLFY